MGVISGLDGMGFGAWGNIGIVGASVAGYNNSFERDNKAVLNF